MGSGTRVLRILPDTPPINDTVGECTVRESEILRVHSPSGITLGGSSGGQTIVRGLTMAVDNSRGPLRFESMNVGSTAAGVLFADSMSQFSKGISLKSRGGVVLSQSVQTSGQAPPPPSPALPFSFSPPRSAPSDRPA